MTILGFVMILIFGYSFSLVGGHYATRAFLNWLRSYQKIEKPAQVNDEKPVPPWLLGAVERFFFTTMVAFDIAGAGIAMIAWLGIKMATHWNREEGAESVNLAMSALAAGIVSMTFAMIGGLICR